MNRPNPAEEQEAVRLEEFLTALRQDPDAIPVNEVNPGIAEIYRLAAESERTGSQLITNMLKRHATGSGKKPWQTLKPNSWRSR